MEHVPQERVDLSKMSFKEIIYTAYNPIAYRIIGAYSFMMALGLIPLYVLTNKVPWSYLFIPLMALGIFTGYLANYIGVIKQDYRKPKTIVLLLGIMIAYTFFLSQKFDESFFLIASIIVFLISLPCFKFKKPNKISDSVPKIK